LSVTFVAKLWSGVAAAALLTVPNVAAAQAVARPLVVTPSPAARGLSKASPPPRARHSTGDPIEGVNRAFYSINTVLDRLLFRPLAFTFKTAVPKPIRVGLRHVFLNLNEPVVFLNDMLQLRPKRAARTAARFVINSTLGVGGVLDIAKLEKLDIPHRNNGFGDTLGRYGVGPGPYFYFPLSGPTDLRDIIGGQADGIVLPLAVGDPFNRTEYLLSRAVLTGLDQRVEADADLNALLGSAVDPYATLRSVYLQNRAAEIAEIRHGSAGASALDDPLADPEAPVAGARAKDAFDSTPQDPEPVAPPALTTPSP